MTNSQAIFPLGFGHWNLGFDWDLELGHWDLIKASLILCIMYTR